MARAIAYAGFETQASDIQSAVVTIESVLFVDAKTLLVINDNNFPGRGGRTTSAPDATEFLLIKLDNALDLDDSDNQDRNRDREHRAD